MTRRFLPSPLRSALAGAAGFLAAAFAGPAAADELFGPIAAALLDGIRTADVARIPAASGYGSPTISVRPFAENEVPVPADVANAWNGRLLAELQRQARGQFGFVDRAALPALVAEIERSGGSDAERADRISDLRASARADILVAGTITLSGTTPVLDYRAVATESGRLFATSAPVRMPFPDPAPPPSPSQLRVAGVDFPPTDLPPRRNVRRRIAAEAERLLRRLGYDPGPVDGIITWETRRALRDYQADSALPITGRMTRQVVENMRRDMR